MSVPQTVAEVLHAHVTLECESIDRMYLNLYVPQLQWVGGVVGYLHVYLLLPERSLGSPGRPVYQGNSVYTSSRCHNGTDRSFLSSFG